MDVNWTAAWAFVAAATALLGSPGTGIAALLAVGRAEGWGGGLPYYAGLQMGLALACGATGAGLVSLLAVFPLAVRTLAVLSVLYLVYLAFRIATSTVENPNVDTSNVRASSVGGSPVVPGTSTGARTGTGTGIGIGKRAHTGRRAGRLRSLIISGFLLGVSNPKAYLAFVSLLGSRALLQGGHHHADLLIKCGLCVMVIVVVDLAWLFAGVQLRRLRLGARAERILNLVLGATVLLAAVIMGVR